MKTSRRQFLKTTSASIMGATLVPGALSRLAADAHDEKLFSISLAEWSLHRTIRNEKKMTNLDFPKVAKREFGIDAIEYVNQFFMDKAKDRAYLADLRNICQAEGVKSLLIMVDGEGALGDSEESKRLETVEKHKKWVHAAKFLGCHSIRVNAATGRDGTYEEKMKLAADGLRKLSEYAAGVDINVIVENHGGLSSNGAWLAGVMKLVSLPNCGTLPDFGNFRISGEETYDRYKGVAELMPYAKAVSAKSHDFNEEGDEVHTDYFKMMKIVLDAGYHGHVGIEYEGGKISEHEGIIATKKLLERVRTKLSA